MSKLLAKTNIKPREFSSSLTKKQFINENFFLQRFFIKLAIVFSLISFGSLFSENSKAYADPHLDISYIQIDDISLYPTPPDGAPFTLSVRVKNYGDETTSTASLKYYQSDDTTIDTTDTPLTDGTNTVIETINPLSPGAETHTAPDSFSLSLNASNTIGTYYYGACIEGDFDNDTIDEIECSDALAVIVSDPSSGGSPDLGISYFSINDTSLTTSQTFTLSAIVKNTGSGDATNSTTIRYYRSTNGTIPPTDTSVGNDSSVTVGTLNAGDPSSTITWDISAPSASGTYYYGVCVATFSGESNDTNNCSKALAITVTESTPDLSISFLSASTASPTTGNTFTLTAQAKNTDQGDSAATEIYYYRSSDSTISTSDTELGSTSINSLTKDESSEKKSISVTAPSSAGTYYYGACVKNVSNESNTTNNCSSALALSVSESSPDLLISYFSASDSNLGPGKSLTLSTRAKNNGDKSASGVTVNYYRSSDSTIDESDENVGSSNVGNLSSGGTQSSTLSVVTTSPTATGNYYYGACVEKVSGESSTTNNCSNGVLVNVSNSSTSTTTSTTIQKPDLLISYLSVSDISLNPGTELTISSEVKNSGQEVSSGSNLIFYLSDDSTIDFLDTPLGTASIQNLNVGESSSRETIILTATSTLGTYYLGTCVETISNELSVTNNCSNALTIKIEEVPTNPDLIISYIQISDSTLKPESSFNISAKAKNSGTADGSSSLLYYYYSEDNKIDFSDTLIGSKQVEALSVGAETSIKSISTKAPSFDGTYYYGACVAPISNELSTSNNCSSLLSIVVDEDTDTPFTADDPNSVTDGTIIGNLDDFDDIVDQDPDETLDAPVITATINDLRAVIDWDAVENATGYKLFYAPLFYQGEHTIQSIDVGNQTGYMLDLQYGDAYLIAAKAYNNNTESAYSNIEKLVINRTTYRQIGDISSTELDPFALYHAENTSNSETLAFVNSLGLDFIDQIIMPSLPDSFFAYFSALSDDIESASLNAVTESLPTVTLSCYANKSRNWVLPMIIYNPSGNEDIDNNLDTFKLNAEFDFRNVQGITDESTDRLIHSFETNYNKFGEPTIFKVKNVYVLVPKAHYMFLEDAGDKAQAIGTVTRSEDNEQFPNDLGIIVSSLQDAVIEFELEFNASQSMYNVINDKCIFETQ